MFHINVLILSGNEKELFWSNSPNGTHTLVTVCQAFKTTGIKRWIEAAWECDCAACGRVYRIRVISRSVEGCFASKMSVGFMTQLWSLSVEHCMLGRQSTSSCLFTAVTQCSSPRRAASSPQIHARSYAVARIADRILVRADGLISDCC